MSENTAVNTAAPSADAPPQLPPQVALMQMVMGYWVAQAIYVAARLNIAGLLADGPRTAEDLAGAAEAHAPTLYRLLRGLAAVGVFAELPGCRFALTPLSEALKEGPGSARAMTLHLVEDSSWQAWGKMLESVKTGETGFVLAHGQEVFPYYAEHPESTVPFNQAMIEYSEAVSAAVIQAYDFSGFKTVADIGGGHGGLVAAILQATPSLRGMVFDLPHVVSGAKPLFEAAGLADRCELAAGDFFRSVPAGADAYVLKAIIHDWDDERALTILKNVRAAMADGGKVLLVETVVPGPDAGPLGVLPKLGDLHMLAMTGGRERTAEEFGELLARAGLRMTRVIPTAVLVGVVEAVKA